MKKMILLFVSSCSLMACATLQQQPVNWTGQNFDDYVLTYGVPASQYTSSNGNIIYSFKTACQYDPMKEGETLVVVGENNLIQNVSTSINCPSYIESPEYQREQHRLEMIRQEERNKKRIEDLEKSLQGVETTISSLQITIKSAQSDIDHAYLWKDADARRKEAEQKLKKAQEELKEKEEYKARWENELRQLKSMQYK